MAQTMKNIRKAHLRRQVLADPTMAQKLVAVEASPVYNSRGELIQSVGTTS
jgi:HD-like signal output (HDOD) protein